MALNKKELYEKIKELPEFEFRDIKVKEDNSKEGIFNDIENYKAICEVGNSLPYSFVTKSYKLVQFYEIFKPIVDDIEGDLRAYVVNFGGFAMMKMFPELDELKDKNSKYGIVAMNSVDKSTAITVKFCVEHGENQFTIPPKIAGLKKQHNGNVKNITKDYISMIGKVKQAWKNIVNSFPEYSIVINVEENKDENKKLLFSNVVENMKIGSRLEKKIKAEYEEITKEGKSYSLWQFFMKVMEEITKLNYKSDAHREKRIDSVCQAVFKYSFLLNI